MTTSPNPQDRAERLAALKARRSADQASEPTASSVDATGPGTPSTPWQAPTHTDAVPPPPTASSPRTPAPTKRTTPARAARIATVGASLSAVLGLMTVYGLAERQVSDASGTAPNPPSAPVVGSTVGSRTVSVPAGTPVVVLMIDASGRPIDLTTMPSAEALAGYLQGLAAAPSAPSLPVTTPESPLVLTSDASTGGVTNGVGEIDASPAPGAQQPAVASAKPARTPTSATTTTQPPAPTTTASPSPAPPSAPATTAAPTAPSSTVEAAPAPAATTPPPAAPAPTVPVATPAPIQLTVPIPAVPAPQPAPQPAQGSTRGS